MRHSHTWRVDLPDRRVARTMNTISPGSWARVRVHPDCPGDARRPHHPAEDGCRVEVTTVDNDGEHSAFALYKGRVDSYVGPRPGRRPRPRPLLPARRAGADPRAAVVACGSAVLSFVWPRSQARVRAACYPGAVAPQRSRA